MAGSSEPPPLADATRVCAMCGQRFPLMDVVRFGDSWVCAICKPLFVQRLREGVELPQGRFKDLSRLTAWLKALLILNIVVLCLAIVSDYFEYRAVRDGVVTTAGEISPRAVALTTIGMLQLNFFVAGSVLFLRWIYLANKNPRSLGAAGMRFTPAWAVGWYFIPVANLWKPYQAMKEIWQASSHPSDWRHVAVPRILPLWWTFWIVSMILSQASFRITMRADEQTNQLLAARVTLLSDLIDIPLNLIAIRLVVTIWAVQRQAAAERAAA